MGPNSSEDLDKFMKTSKKLAKTSGTFSDFLSWCSSHQGRISPLRPAQPRPRPRRRHSLGWMWLEKKSNFLTFRTFRSFTSIFVHFWPFSDVIGAFSHVAIACTNGRIYREGPLLSEIGDLGNVLVRLRRGQGEVLARSE